ncbi:MAG: tetratricopeptide repeat protein [Vicingaceae bacterium]
MRKYCCIISLVFIQFFGANCFAQQGSIDSLKLIWNNENNHDTIRLNAFHKVIKKGYQYKKPDSAIILAKEQYLFAKTKGIKGDMAAALTTQGIANAVLSNNEKAIACFKQSLNIQIERDNKKGIADSYSNIGVIYYNQTDYPKSLKYYEKGLKIREELNDYKGLANSYNNMANIYDNTGQVEKALEYHNLSLELKKEQGDEDGIATSKLNIALVYRDYSQYSKALGLLNEVLIYRQQQGEKLDIARTLYNIGIVYQDQGVYAKSATNYIKCLKIYEDLGNKKGIASSLSNLGILYSVQKEYDEALIYFEKGLAIRKEIGHERGISESMSNIADLLVEKGSYNKALEMYAQSLVLLKKIGYKDGIASVYRDESFVYKKQKKYKEAIKKCNQAISIYEEIKSKEKTSKTLTQLGNIYFEQGAYKKAKDCGLKAFNLANDLEINYLIERSSFLLYKVHKVLGDKTNALKMFEKSVAIKDSISKLENDKELIKQTYKYRYEKQAITDSIKSAEAHIVSQSKIKAQKAQISKEKTLRFALYFGLAILVLFGGLMYNRFKKSQHQKMIIEHQRDEVEEAHREIRDSINYAERIQRSFLATDELLNNNLKDYFVFFQPKDVVSGDFYWAGKLANNQFAVVNADSTGHGVPGAIMSILNISSIEKAIDNKLVKPSDIFNHTRDTIIERLSKDGSEGGGKDGMDASIIAFDFENNKFSYTAAQNPIWVVRGEELIEIKGEKMPIGKHDNDTVPFVGGEFEMQKGDVIYTVTDGFQDQFGGEKGKKFKVRPFKNYLTSIAHLPMQEQKEKLQQSFVTWKGEEEQVDDVCVIGVRV